MTGDKKRGRKEVQLKKVWGGCGEEGGGEEEDRSGEERVKGCSAEGSSRRKGWGGKRRDR